jgi:hypothetical protein
MEERLEAHVGDAAAVAVVDETPLRPANSQLAETPNRAIKNAAPVAGEQFFAARAFSVADQQGDCIR